MLACFAKALLCSVKSGFTTLMNKQALHIISSPCVLRQHALAHKAHPEYLKTVLKLVTEHVNFIRARARVFKVLYKDGLLFIVKEGFIPNWCVATATFPNFDVDWVKSFRCVEAHI